MKIRTLLAATVLSVLGTHASAATLNISNNFLEVNFSTPIQPSQHNAIGFSFASLSRFGSLTGTASLYDGTTLLGSHSVTDSVAGRFFDPSSAFAALPFGTSIDYSSISDGTIDGRFTFQITSASNGASFSFDPKDFRISTFGDSGNSGFDGIVTSGPVISSVPVSVVPLPAALPLLIGGLGFLGLAGYRRRNSA